MKHVKRKQKSLETIQNQNPFNKSKDVQFYEQLSKRMQELKLTMIAMNNEFVKLTE